MKRRVRGISIGLESLEGRRVLSTASTGSMIATLKGALTSGISYLDVQGTAEGSTSPGYGNPDVGARINFQGSATVSGLGSFNVSGSLSGTGFIAKGRVEGTIILSNSQGILSLKLQGPTESGFQSPKSGTYRFTISHATGDFGEDFGNGTVQLNLKSSSFAMTFLGKPNMY